MTEAKSLLDLAVRLAREAGAIQKDRYETDLDIQTKSASIDLVTEVDKACEKLIVDGIQAHRPGDAVLAEEGSGDDREGAEWRWVVDPLDGTTNFAHAYPRFCVSIAVEHNDDRVVGAVYDPLLDEMYTAVKGQGAFLNGRPIHVSDEQNLDNALLATGFAYDVRKTRDDNIAEFTRFLKATRAVRRDGSAALDLCYVAAGRLDAFWEFKLRAWDVAAGFLIVDEAGGRCSDASGGPPLRSGRETVASNAHLHEAIIALLDH